MLGIIPSTKRACIVSEGRFSAQRVSSDSQLVIMDVWTTNSLSCEDAKRLLQGGYLMLPRKHQSAKRVNLKCGFFITTNVLPDFGVEVDQEAVSARLKVFATRPLRKKDCSVTGMLLVAYYSLPRYAPRVAYFLRGVSSSVLFYFPLNPRSIAWRRYTKVSL